MTQRWQYPVKAEPVLPEALRSEATDGAKWYQPFSEPVRRGAGALLAAALVASGAVYVADPDTVDPPVGVLDYGWYQPLSEPLPRAGTATLPGGETRNVEPVAAPVPEPELGWLVALAEPTLPLPTPVQPPAFSTDPDALTRPEATSSDKWFLPLSEPLRSFPRSVAALVASGEARDVGLLAAPTPDYGWFLEFSRPVLPPEVPRYPPAFEIDRLALTQPEVTSLDRWFQPLSEPFPATPRNEAAHEASGETQLYVALGPPAPDYGWFQPLSLPLPPVVLPPAAMPSLFLNPISLPRPPAPDFVQMEWVYPAAFTFPPPLRQTEWHWELLGFKSWGLEPGIPDDWTEEAAIPTDPLLTEDDEPILTELDEPLLIEDVTPWGQEAAVLDDWTEEEEAC